MAMRIIFLNLLALFCVIATGTVASSAVYAAGGGPGQHDGRFGARREQLKEQLMQLPPEQRKTRVEELKQEMSAAKAQKLEQRKEEFQGKWNNASPEQREKFCANVKQKCAEGGRKFACEVAESKCAAGQ
ncbi:MAG: hypothetical protein JWO78_797 [Micavibrio sp.]|nr:hypothetical protein [Micavibrio sp.]